MNSFPDRPLVSIIIPFFNRYNLTELAVESVLNQTYSNFEIILVDDGSNEPNQPNFENLDPRIKLVKIKNSGPSIARNIGAQKSSGSYLMFLDSDDTFESNKIEFQINYMTSHPNCNISHTSYLLVDNNCSKFINSGSFSGSVYPKIILRCPIATPTVCIKRIFFSEYTFPEDMKIGEDVFLWTSISMKHEIHGIELPLTNVLKHDSSTAYDLKNKYNNNLKIINALRNKLKINFCFYCLRYFIIFLKYRINLL